MYYYEIAPLTYIGKDNELLTYQSEKELVIGTAVVIPLRNKKTTGIILSSVAKPTFSTKEVLEVLFEQPILTKEMIELAYFMAAYYSASLVSVLTTIIPSGIAKKRRAVQERSSGKKIKGSAKLSADQKFIYKEIMKSNSKPHLIFGITGSGKTEIYIKLIEETIKAGKEAIVLVPEISLTPSALARYQEVFGDQIALLHSQLKETERFKNWLDAFQGNKKIVLGSRSAIFAPFKNLGLIIIDEEHENSYKQDKTPRYQTVKVAEELAKATKATLVLGSATPKIETFFRAKKDEYFLHSLNKRFIQDNLPETEIVDMRNEYKHGNKSIFSERLQAEILSTLAKKQQVLLFLNRRGMSTFVSCRDCGYVEKCPNCELPLTFHFNDLNLVCHHCNYQKKAPVTCPSCKSLAIKYFGTGTQRVEQELRKVFGNKYQIGRMDADTTRKREMTETLYNNFAQGDYDILIGTQMVSKGWDLSNIGLVGIISADTSINFPDYTAAERTFDLVTQVAGRTGRGKDQGKVIIQTYNPDYPAIIAASKHDYNLFYEDEIKTREDLFYPPFANLIKLVYNNLIQKEAVEASESLKALVEKELENANISFSILGPSPAFIPKMNNRYYYQISLKIFTNVENEIKKTVKILERLTNKEWSIDIDPADLL